MVIVTAARGSVDGVENRGTRLTILPRGYASADRQGLMGHQNLIESFDGRTGEKLNEYRMMRAFTF